MTFIDKDGQEVKIAASKGDNLLDLAQAHDVEMEGEHHNTKPASDGLGVRLRHEAGRS